MGPAGGLRRGAWPVRRDAASCVRDAEDGVVERDPEALPRPAARVAAHHAGPRRTARRRAGARQHAPQGRARRPAAVVGRHPGRRQPAARLLAEPRAHRALPAWVDVQGRHDGRAAARRPVRRETVPCPPTTTVNGRSFRNFEGSAAGDVPFRVDFAQSCNTAFISLADRLERSALTVTARDFGVGAPARARRHRRGGQRARGRRCGRARGDDDRPGPDPRHAAGDGGRGRDRRGRPLASAAPGPRRRRAGRPPLPGRESATLRS